MIQIIYLSVAVRPLDQHALDALVEEARARNLRDAITGVLHFDGERFMQVIEGPDDATDAVMASIARDPRHHRVLVVARRTIERREFGMWSMALRQGGDDADRMRDQIEARMESANPDIRMRALALMGRRAGH